MSQNYSEISGNRNVVVQLNGDANTINVYGKPYLALSRPDVARPPAVKELELLDPFRRAVPLSNREADMQSLLEWTRSAYPISIRTIVGRAGAGKTRIAVELIHELDLSGLAWDAGFLSAREVVRFMNSTNLSQWGWCRPTLIIVDYAAVVVAGLRIWLQELSEITHPAYPPLRILLLERDASTFEGWLWSLQQHGWSDRNVIALFHPPEPVTLQPLTGSSIRRFILESAMNAASALTQSPLPKLAIDADASLSNTLSNAVWSEPLCLIMAGILAVGMGSAIVEVLGLARTDLAFGLADRELSRLARFAGDNAQQSRLLQHMAACATLAGGLGPELALAVVAGECAELARLPAGGPGALLHTATTALNRAGGGIAAVTPDIVGEALLLRVLATPSMQGADKATVIRMHGHAGASVVASVIRTAQDFVAIGYPQPLEWLKGLVEAGRGAEDLDILLQIEYYLSTRVHDTICLRTVAAEISECLVARLSGAEEMIDDLPLQEGYAVILSNLVGRLNGVGRSQEALKFAALAEAIHRELARRSPERILPQFVTSLTNAAGTLESVGRYEDALSKCREAELLAGQLAENDWDRFSSKWICAVAHLAYMMRVVGLYDKSLAIAEKAVALLQRWKADSAEYGVKVRAKVFGALADSLYDTGNFEKACQPAQECVNLFRQLAAVNADAYLPLFAQASHRLANIYGRTKQLDAALVAAQVATNIRAGLVASSGDAYLSSWCASAGTLAGCLEALGKPNDALPRALEVADTFKILHAKNPTVYTAQLGRALGLLGRIYRALGRVSDAATAYENAIQVLSPLFLYRPGPLIEVMAGVASDYASFCQESGAEFNGLLVKDIFERIKAYNQTGSWEH